MSLQRKFAVLLVFLGGIVAANTGIAVWSLRFLQSELTGPLAAIEPVLAGLHTVKRGVEAQWRLLPAGAPAGDATAAGRHAVAGGEAPPARERAVQARTLVGAALDDLESIDEYRLRAGSTLQNLRTRLGEADHALDRWLDAPNPRSPESLAAAAEASRGYFGIHELIELVEGRVVANAAADLTWAATLRRQLLFVLVVSLALVGLSAGLAVILVRRLVVQPVGVLRTATGRLAQGDFTHRIPVTGTDELAMLSGEVNHMAAMIGSMQDERVERERLAAIGEMVKRITHNLRNPLAGIRSLAELTRSELDPGSPARDSQDRIIKTVDRFEGWLSDLLRNTSPLRVYPEAIPVARWLDAALQPLSAMAGARDVRVVLTAGSAPERAWIDPHHMEQVVVAVVTNAVQASPRGGVVRVHAFRDTEEGWAIRVSDDGPGVPPELRAQVFRPSFTTKRDGTGMGLAMAKQVVEQHGGRIWVDDRPAGSTKADPGAMFVIWMPLDRPAELANTGQVASLVGEMFGQDPDHRRRGEPEVLHPPGAGAGRA